MNVANVILQQAFVAMRVLRPNRKSASHGRIVWAILLAIIFGACIDSASLTAQTYSTLYDFATSPDTGYPSGNLIMDTGGNLYGTGSIGGANQRGAVFQLSPPSSPGGAWKETVIHSFTPGGDGTGPFGQLAIDKAGNLYGVTYSGGNNSCVSGCGVVFKLKPPTTQGGAWSYRIMYTFMGGSDGFYPGGGVVVDSKGALYGNTFYGGTYFAPGNDYSGTVFKLHRRAAHGLRLLCTVLAGQRTASLPILA